LVPGRGPAVTAAPDFNGNADVPAHASEYRALSRETRQTNT